MATTHTSRPLEELRTQGRRGGLADGERRRAAFDRRIEGKTTLEIYRAGYQAGYRAGLRPLRDRSPIAVRRGW